LPPSADRDALRAAVDREIAALEDQCAEIERALTAKDWDAFAAVMADARRVTHALENAMEAAAPARDAAYDASVYERARRVHAIRENQVARLRTYNEAVAEKLGQIAQLKRFAKNVGAKSAPSRLASLDRLT
jgi:hypothetical protein